MSDGYRPLTPSEHAILERLLEVSFDGRDNAREQLRYLKARFAPGCEQHCRSLELVIDVDAPLIPHSGDQETRVDAEGWAIDEDGIPVEIMLFQKGGHLSYLEVVVFSEQLKRELIATEIRVGSSASVTDELTDHTHA